MDRRLPVLWIALGCALSLAACDDDESGNGTPTMSACEPDTPGGAGDEEPARDDCPGYTSCVGSADCGDCFDECRDVIDCAVTCDCDDFQCFLACYEVDSGSCSSCSEAQDACLQDACGGELDVCHG